MQFKSVIDKLNVVAMVNNANLIWFETDNLNMACLIDKNGPHDVRMIIDPVWQRLTGKEKAAGFDLAGNRFTRKDGHAGQGSFSRVTSGWIDDVVVVLPIFF